MFLPSGLSDANGQITGTPTLFHNYINFTVTATDDEGQTNLVQFSLIVLSPVYPYNIPFSLRFNNETNTVRDPKYWSTNDKMEQEAHFYDFLLG